MKFTRVIGRKELLQASIFGSVAGLVGVIFFILMLNSMNTTMGVNEVAEEGSTEGQEEVIPVQSTEDPSTSNMEYQQFYANQFGMFSSFDAATNFIAAYPSLNTSAIIKVDESYYVWSTISPLKDAIIKSDNPASFTKPFKLSGSACEDPKIQNLPTLLAGQERSKFYFEGNQVPENFPADWQTITAAMASLSADLDVTRVHLLKHYYELNSCMKIQF